MSSENTSFRLVARFSDFKKAAATAEELRALFTKRSSEWEGSSVTCRIPDVISVNDVLAIHHPQRGDFGDDVKQLLEANDAEEVGAEENGMLTLTAAFRLPMGKPGEQLGKELRAFFDQGKTISSLREWKTAPFGETLDLSHGEAKDTAWSHEGSLFELHLPGSAATIDAIKKFLMSRKVEQLKLRLCAFEDLARLGKAQAIADNPPPKKAASADESALPTIGKRFLFTGKMASLTRDDGKKRVLWLGGISAGSVSRELDYLVVGDDGSPLYGQGAKGSKIVAAEKLQATGSSLKIISEKQFLELKKK